MFKKTVVESPNGEISMYARKCPGDREVLREVIMQDVYGLDALDNKGFEPDVVIDIGANIGAFSAVALKFWQNVRIAAYEPHPISYGLLCQNLLHHRSQTNLHLAAVSGRDLPNSNIQISLEAATDAPHCWDLNQRSERQVPDPTAQGCCQCIVENINDVLPASLPESDEAKTLLKVDCEGSEFYIIEGVAEEHLKRIDVIKMEVHCSQLAIPGYLDTTWTTFRDKILAHFDCPEIESRTTVAKDQFIATAIRR